VNQRIVHGVMKEVQSMLTGMLKIVLIMRTNYGI